MMHKLLIAAVLLGAEGCGHTQDSAALVGLDTADMTPCDRAALEPLRASLGTGEAVFVPLSDGDALPFYQGLQGLWHVFGSFWATGVMPGDPEDFASPDNPIVTFQVLLDGAALGGYEDLPRPMDPSADGGFELVGDILVLEIEDPVEIAERQATLSIHFADSCGVSMSDSRAVVLVDGR